MPAYEYSSLQILPDPACIQGSGLKNVNAPKSQRQELNFACVCRNTKEKVADGTLVIDDGRQGEEASWKMRSATTYGYDSTKQDAGRHKLSFGVLPSVDGPNKKDILTTNMAHEFGYVLGLRPEHQRGDRDIYLHYDPRRIKGYSDAKRRAAAVQYRMEFPKGASISESFNLVLTDHEYASQFFPEVLDYIPTTADHHHPMAPYTTFDPRLGFDMGSIMLPNSDHDCETVESEKPGCALMRKDKEAGPEAYLHMGGKQNKGRISAGDIKRVAQLYPGTQQQQHAVEELRQWRGGPKSVPEYVSEWIVEPNPVDVVPMQTAEAVNSHPSSDYEGSECPGTDSEGHHTEFEEDEHEAESDGEGVPSSSGSECPGSL